jgi:CelD/BcsL family acetyltransferase involved in cellulose biosynthesis
VSYSQARVKTFRKEFGRRHSSVLDSQAGEVLSHRESVEVIDTRAGFDGLREAWETLFARAGEPANVFQSHGWLSNWANHYLDETMRLAIVIGSRDGRLVMVWPLVVIHGASFRQLRWMGDPVSQYGDVLVEHCAESDHWLRAGWKKLTEIGADVAYLRKVRDGSTASSMLRMNGAAVVARHQAPYLTLDGARDFETYEKRWSAKLRSSRRRYSRRLESEGRITFEEHVSGPRAWELTNWAIRYKKDWVKTKGIVAPALMDPRFQRFFSDVALGQIHSPPIRVVAVLCDGKPIGVEISFTCKGHLFGHLISRNSEFEKKGVGSVLTEFAVRSAHRRGFAVYDLLAPSDPHKREWANKQVETVDWAASFSLRGRLYTRAWLGFGRPCLKRAVDSLRGRLGASLAQIIENTH